LPVQKHSKGNELPSNKHRCLVGILLLLTKRFHIDSKVRCLGARPLYWNKNLVQLRWWEWSCCCCLFRDAVIFSVPWQISGWPLVWKTWKCQGIY